MSTLLLARRANTLATHTRSYCFVGDSTEGGAYPLSTVDIIALAALFYVVTKAFRTARNYLDRPPIKKRQ